MRFDQLNISGGMRITASTTQGGDEILLPVEVVLRITHG
jgi:hypothetical protein